jgi:Ca-activated chloride channel family protein
MLPELAALEYFHFLRPWWGLALPPLLLAFYVMDRKADQGDLFGGIIAPHLLEHLRLSKFQSRWFNPRSFTKVLTVLLIVVLMGPSWRQQPSPLSQDEAAMVILLDVSQSMQQRDIQPSRLQRAKQKVGDLLALRPDKRAALIVYAGSAHTVLNLTADQEILGQYLAAIQPNIMPRDGKFPEYALPEIQAVLQDSTAPATVVLFTDGLGADSEQAYKDFFEVHPHQLLVIGVGTDQDLEGSIPLEEASLRELADATDGHYQALTVDDKDVRNMNRRINNHYVIIDDSALPWLDSGYPLVFPALALFLLWFRRGWTLTWGWLLVPALLLQPTPAVYAQDEPEVEQASSASSHWFADLWLTPDQQGRLLLRQKDYREAARRFHDPMWKGLSLYYAEDFMVAAEYF